MQKPLTLLALVVVMLGTLIAAGPADNPAADGARSPQPAATPATQAASEAVAAAKGDPAVLLDVDLTSGRAGKQAIEASGGRWEGGWVVMKGGAERIVWDLGREVPAGEIEIRLTAAEVNGKKPWDYDGKINWAGAYQGAQLQHRAGGSKVYLRTGNGKYGFSRLKASDKPFDHSEMEASLGKTSNWTLDGKTVHTIRLTWSPGKLQFEGPGGISAKTEKYKSFGFLRYVFIGCDKTYGSACAGMKFLSVKVTESQIKP